MIQNLSFLYSLFYLLVLIQLNKLKKSSRKKEIVLEFNLENHSLTYLLDKVKIKLQKEELSKETNKDIGLCFKIFI